MYSWSKSPHRETQIFYSLMRIKRCIHLLGPTPLAPLPVRKGGMARGCARGLGFHGVIYSLKAIRTARETNLQKAMRSPFPCRKGGRGDRSYEEGEEHLSFVLGRVLKGDSVMDDSSMSLGDWSRLASYSLSTLNSHCWTSYISLSSGTCSASYLSISTPMTSINEANG